MNVFPKARLQSADEWLERIDTIKRQQAKLVAAKQDKRLEMSISQLVAATNEDMSGEPKKVEAVGEGVPAPTEQPDQPMFTRRRIRPGQMPGAALPASPSQRRSLLARLMGWTFNRGPSNAMDTQQKQNEAEQ